jgi:Uma2 family endonuclease
MAATTTHLMTVEEFSQPPEDSGPVYHELRHGEVIELTRAKYKHYSIQRRLRRLLEKFAPADAMIDIEFAFQPKEYEFRIADVAYVSPEREKAIEGYLNGAPDLVIEVLSPSNPRTALPK